LKYFNVGYVIAAQIEYLQTFKFYVVRADLFDDGRVIIEIYVDHILRSL